MTRGITRAVHGAGASRIAPQDPIDRTSPTARTRDRRTTTNRHDHETPARSGEIPHRRHEMFTMIEELARDRMRQVEFDLRAVRTAQRARAKRKANLAARHRSATL